MRGRRWNAACWWLSRRLGGRHVFGNGYWLKPSDAGFSFLPWVVRERHSPLLQDDLVIDYDLLTTTPAAPGGTENL